MIWGKEEVDRLEELWNKGLRSSQIANILGVTRNAIMGAIHRNGLQRGVKKVRTGRPRKEIQVKSKTFNFGSKKKRRVLVKQPPTPERPEAVIDLSHVKQLMQLQLRDCRWPIGNPKSHTFVFCGAVTKDGSPYCSYHTGVAYIVSQKKKYA